MNDPLSAARHVLRRLSPSAFVAALDEADQAALWGALLDRFGLKAADRIEELSTLNGRLLAYVAKLEAELPSETLRRISL